MLVIFLQIFEQLLITLQIKEKIIGKKKQKQKKVITRLLLSLIKNTPLFPTHQGYYRWQV